MNAAEADGAGRGFPWVFHIAVDETAADHPTLKLQWNDATRLRVAHLPNVAGTHFLVLPKRGQSTPEFSDSPIVMRRLDPIAALWTRLRGLWMNPKYILDFERFRIFMGGARSDRRVLVAATKYLKKLGTDRKSTRLNSSHSIASRMPSSA